MESNPNILSHVSIGANDLPRALAFYDRVLATLGCKRIMQHDDAVAFGKAFPEFWVQTPLDGQPASTANGVHIAFVAESRAQVDAFHAAALTAGARDNGAPGPRPDYGEPYYGCFVADPEGHRIEAAFWDQTLADA